MPELLAHTNMDTQAMSKVRTVIEAFVKFLAKDPSRWTTRYESGLFRSPYTHYQPLTGHIASPRYVERSRVAPGSPSPE
jgi:hypothetical protein